MKQQGEITVFLSLSLLSVIALICVMTESARLAGSRYYFQSAVNGALDNLCSQYHRRLWDKYRIFGLPYESEQEMSGRLSECVEKYLEVENWYPMDLETVEISECVGLTDQGGDHLTREVLDYMSYGIWSSLALPPENGEQVLKDVKEAVSAGVMADACDGQEKEVRKLEQAVNRIVKNVKDQEKAAGDIADSLSSDDPDGFRQKADEFRKVERKMPGLVQAYEKQADKLRKKMAASRGQLDEVRKEFQEGRQELFEEQMDPYDDYVNQDGSRYQEILAQQQTGQQNVELLDRVEELVDELEREYEERRDEEDTEEGWEESLSLSPAGSLWDGFCSSRWNLEESAGDEEKRGLLDQARQLVQGRLLELVMPADFDISSAALPVSSFPSQRIGGTSLHSLNPAERVLLYEYCGNFFLNAVSAEKRPVQYEMEYLLKGADSDRKNLEEAVTQLFLIRQGLNLIHILSDTDKREEARTLAFTVVGATGIAPLAEITACFIMGVWAAAEAAEDLRVLLSGGKIPLWKGKDDWQLSLEGLLRVGAEGKFPETEKEQRGFTYGTYLQMMCFLTDVQTLQMRMLDVMEMNIRREDPGFSAEKCAYMVDICGKAGGKHVFFELPIVENLLGKASGYPLEAPARRAY